jgi:hypothetical protein
MYQRPPQATIRPNPLSAFSSLFLVGVRYVVLLTAVIPSPKAKTSVCRAVGVLSAVYCDDSDSPAFPPSWEVTVCQADA